MKKKDGGGGQGFVEVPGKYTFLADIKCFRFFPIYIGVCYVYSRFGRSVMRNCRDDEFLWELLYI